MRRTTTTPTSGSSGSDAPISKTIGTGVTDKTIKIGVALVDFKCIAPYIQTTRIDEYKVYDAFIADINAKGGVAGRKLVPVYRTFCPIVPAPALSLCTQFTEDDHVFAVLGDFVDLTGQAQPCIAKDHDTVLITIDLTDAIINSAPGGMILGLRRTAGTPRVDPARVVAEGAHARRQEGRGARRGDDAEVGRQRARAGAEADGRRPRHDRDPQHRRLRHDGRVGTADELHREVEDRGRRHGVPLRSPGVGPAVRARPREAHAGRAAARRQQHGRHVRPEPPEGRSEPEPVRRDHHRSGREREAVRPERQLEDVRGGVRDVLPREGARPGDRRPRPEQPHARHHRFDHRRVRRAHDLQGDRRSRRSLPRTTTTGGTSSITSARSR